MRLLDSNVTCNEGWAPAEQLLIRIWDCSWKCSINQLHDLTLTTVAFPLQVTDASRRCFSWRAWCSALWSSSCCATRSGWWTPSWAWRPRWASAWASEPCAAWWPCWSAASASSWWACCSACWWAWLLWWWADTSFPVVSSRTKSTAEILRKHLQTIRLISTVNRWWRSFTTLKPCGSPWESCWAPGPCLPCWPSSGSAASSPSPPPRSARPSSPSLWITSSSSSHWSTTSMRG